MKIMTLTIFEVLLFFTPKTISFILLSFPVVLWKKTLKGFSLGFGRSLEKFIKNFFKKFFFSSRKKSRRN